ncbi:MAG: hypothetical protein ACYDHH_29700 [Solirubrobacteraceae bacterium]
MESAALLVSSPDQRRATQLTRFLYPDDEFPWAGRVPQHGSLTLIGHPGSGADDAVKSIVDAERPGRTAFWLDARLYGDRDLLVDAITERILDQILGSDVAARWRAGQSPAVEVLSSLGPARAAEMSRLLLGEHQDRPSLAHLLALPEGITLGITWAHLLTERSMGRLLWELRAAALTDEANIALVLSTFPATRDLVLGAEAALFGVGAELELLDPTTSRWRELVRIHGLPVRDQDLIWLLLRTGGQARTTAELLDAARHAGPDSEWAARRIWEGCAAEAAARADDQLTLARALTPHGPRLITAIAADRGPYSALARYASPKQISRALAQLAYHAVIYSPRRRHWLLAEPLLQDALSEWSGPS